jgi:hypothetical protein
MNCERRFDARLVLFTPAGATDNQTYFERLIVMNGFLRRTAIAGATLAGLLCSGCAVVAVADAVVTTTAVVVKTGVQATGAVIGAVLPD